MKVKKDGLKEQGQGLRLIEAERLTGHPDNPNRMSSVNFEKLVRNIERTGRYEPLVVRPHPQKKGCFEIINGHHRAKALQRLGYERIECVVWDVDDETAGILLCTLNRLCGRDRLSQRAALLKKLTSRLQAGGLAKLLPETAGQIERLVKLKEAVLSHRKVSAGLANPLVFFVSDEQKKCIEEAVSAAQPGPEKKSIAAGRAAALMRIAQRFLDINASDNSEIQIRM